MRNLIDNGIMDSYAPLVDIKGSYTAQFEHVSFHCAPRTLERTDVPRQFCYTVVERKSSAVEMTTRLTSLRQ